MAFGLSFGSKKNTTKSTSNVDKTETTNQTQTGTQSQTGTTNQSSTGTQTGQSQGSQVTTNLGTTSTTGQTTGTTQQTTSAFSDSTLGAIESAVQNLFGTVGSRAPISAFDAGSFVDSGVKAAQADINAGLESNINQLITNTGGTAGTNSMTALLSNRLRNDAASEVAGVRANLTSQAEEIARNNALADNTLTATDQGFLGNLLSALKGGTVTTTGTESQQTSQQQATQQEGTGRTSEQTAQQNSQQSTQTQELLSQLTQLLQGTTNTKGTESTTATNKSSGGGFSLGF